jgi:hypothetical protein
VAEVSADVARAATETPSEPGSGTAVTGDASPPEAAITPALDPASFERPRLRWVRVYLFGKHPAWADYINPQVLPQQHRSYKILHELWRPAIENHYGRLGAGAAARPHVLAWQKGNRATLVLLRPSHDRGDRRLGQFRRAPLIIGIGANCPLVALTDFAAPRLRQFVDCIGDPALDEKSMTVLLHDVFLEWDAAYREFERGRAPAWRLALRGVPPIEGKRPGLLRRLLNTVRAALRTFERRSPAMITQTAYGDDPLDAIRQWAAVAAFTGASDFFASTRGTRMDVLQQLPTVEQIEHLLRD